MYLLIKRIISILLTVTLGGTFNVVKNNNIKINESTPQTLHEDYAEYEENVVLFSYNEEKLSPSEIEIEITTNSVDENSVKDEQESYPEKEKLEELGLTEITEVYRAPNSSDISTCSAGQPDTLYRAEITGDVEKTCEELKKLDVIEYAQPNYLYRTDDFDMPTEVTNPSPYYSSYQKGYFNAINLTETWSRFETAGTGVRIAIIDDGFGDVSANYPETIYNNLWKDSAGHKGYNCAERNYDISPCLKEEGVYSSHGTNVATIINASANNGYLLGMAYDAQIMLIKAFTYSSTQGETASTINLINGINYALANKANIISMSLGGYYSDSALNAVLDRAYNEGCVCVAAAGNNQDDISTKKISPAGHPRVIAVAALDMDCINLAYFSNYASQDNVGPYIAAPGSGLIGWSYEAGCMSRMSGTSQATPVVSACVALYKSAHPDATVDEIFKSIKDSPTEFVPHTITAIETLTPKMDVLKFVESGCPAAPTYSAAPNSNIEISDDMIVGIPENFSDISSYFNIENGSIKFIPNPNGNGTGSILQIMSEDNKVYKEYPIVVIGDIDGDDVINGIDAVLYSCIVGGMNISISKAQKKACDVNRDGILNDADLNMIINHGLFSSNL